MYLLCAEVCMVLPILPEVATKEEASAGVSLLGLAKVTDWIPPI